MFDSQHEKKYSRYFCRQIYDKKARDSLGTRDGTSKAGLKYQLIRGLNKVLGSYAFFKL